jgi:predicted phosphodiesterase
VKRILFLGDIHAPYHDERAFNLALNFGAKFRPHTVVQMGDAGDFYSTSRHPKNPRRRIDAEWELEGTNECLDQIEEIGAKEHIITLGNHEDNLQRYLAERAPEIYRCLKVEDKLRLDERGWKYCHWKKHIKYGKLLLTHGNKWCGDGSHLKTAAHYEANVIMGHTHRAHIAYLSNARGEHRVAAMVGCLADFKKAEYLYDCDTKNWQHAVGTGYMRNDGVCYVQIHPFVKGTAMLDGKLIRA